MRYTGGFIPRQAKRVTRRLIRGGHNIYGWQGLFSTHSRKSHFRMRRH